MNNLHIEILEKLVSFNTVTPACVDSVIYCKDLFETWGFSVKIHQSGNVHNLVAYLDHGDKILCIAGHLDVVEPGSNWKYPPFNLVEADGKLFGRGTNDMKGPLSAMLAAIHDFIKLQKNLSIMILLTGDEEVMTDNGMQSLMKYIVKYHKNFLLGIIPESCSPFNAGEYIKIGCRGSMNVELSSYASQGHVACTPVNHLHNFINVVHKLVNLHIDNGNDVFEPSKLQLTSIDVGNATRNIVPSNISAEFNIRFNNVMTTDQIKTKIQTLIPNNILCNMEVLSNPFIGCTTEWQLKLSNIVSSYLKKEIKIGAFGGNSDAKTLHKYMNVVEIGSPLAQAHTVDEFILRSDMDKLRNLYYDLLTYLNFE